MFKPIAAILMTALLMQGVGVPAWAAEIRPMTAAERQEAEEEGRAIGEAANAAFVEPTIAESGGERDQGTVVVAGETLQVNKLVPGADRDAMNAELEDAQQGQNKEGLRRVSERQAVRQQDDAMARDIGAIHDAKAVETTQIRETLTNDIDMTRVEEAITGAQNGEIGGESPGNCTTTETRTNREITRNITEEKICERTVARTDQICSRELVVSSVPVWLDGNERALLEVGAGRSGEICRRTVTVEERRPILSMDKIATLSTVPATGGLACTRNRWAEQTVEAVSRTRTQALPINEEIGGVSCQRERWAETVSGSVNGHRDASLNINGEIGGQVGRRWIQPVNGSTTVGGAKTGLLAIDTQSPGLVCSRTAWPSAGTGSNTGSRRVALPVNTEVSRLECRRRIVPASGSSTQSGSQAATLNVDGQSGGWSCVRAIGGANGGGSSAGTQDATLSINNESAGLVAQRWRWLTGGSAGQTSVGPIFLNFLGSSQGDLRQHALAAHVPAGTTSIINFSAEQSNWGTCSNFGGTFEEPSAANGWVHTFMAFRENSNDTGCQVLAGTLRYTFTAIGPASRSWSIQESGNTADTGTPQCPAQWSCGTQAPTTINGLSVSASEVQALGNSLFAGAPTACTSAQLNRVCSGTATGSNTVSIAASLPPGTTSISGFGFSVLNPQPGVSVSLVQTPSAGNGWQAVFNVSRSDWGYQPGNPQIRMTWTASTSSVNTWVWESGNCSDTGSSNCPAQWSCTRTAPSMHEAVTITAAHAAQYAPLYPGAPGNCTYASLDRVCSGTANADTAVSIAGNIPGGVTSITGFNFSVSNPQSGVTVSLLSAPTQANGWVATFRTSRTSWGAVPSAPNINMTWSMDVPTTTASLETLGDCSAASTANCPVSWSCAATAPTLVGGLTVTGAMASSYAPLYPGAASNCANATLDRTCSGTGSLDTVVNITGQLDGATSISGFTHTVNNPQPGITVTVLQVPSAANGWNAILRTSRTSWGTTPAQPDVTLSWTGSVPATNMTVVQTGDCSAGSTAQCAATWSCAQTAPQVVNGITVTDMLAAQVAPLFTAAASNCVVGELRRTCSGTANASSQISIADQIAPGVNSISNFAFVVQNPQSGVSVTLVTAPTQANGWVATFNVARTDFATAKDQPSVRLTWDMQVPEVQGNVQTSGNVSDTGTASCPAVWRCDVVAPTTVSGIPVSAALATGLGPLFPGAPAACADATLHRQCGGSANNITDVSIAGDLPPGTTTITGFGYTVQNPQAGVNVVLISAPTAGNGWVARFQTTRTNWMTTPAAPQVRMTWSVPTSSVSFSVRETGNCNDPGSTSCPTTWTCTGSAPTTINGIAVSAAMVAGEGPLYAGATTACTTADLRRVCTGSTTMGSQIAVGDLIPAGATTIRNFQWNVLNPQPGVTVNLISAPSQGNGWVATFDVIRTVWTSVPARPNVKVDFEVDQIGIALSVRETGNCSDPGSTACPTQWSCAASAPTTVNGLAISLAMVQNEPLLYPGATPACVTGNLNRVCTGTGDQTSDVSIADQLPAGTTEIFNFTWSQTNAPATPGTTVTLVAPPTEANGWVARFNVATNFAIAGTGQPGPEVRLQWQVYGDTQYDVGDTTTGDCNSGDGAGPSCSEEWVCDRYSTNPRHIDPLDRWWNRGGRPPYVDPEPWDPVCLEGRYVRTCAGEGATITEVSIAEHIPAGKTIRNYRWSVSQAIEGVTVTSLQEPAVENTWTARFQTARQNWAVTPPGKPEVLLEWQVEGTPDTSVTVVETGDCAPEGDNFCRAEWTCREHADDENGFVSTPRFTTRSLAAPTETAESVSHQVDLGGLVQTPPMVDFRAAMTAGQGFTIAVVDPPTLENGWKVTVEVRKVPNTSSDFRTVNVRFSWSERVPRDGAAGTITPRDLEGREPLYPGAPLSCIRAEKVYNCSNTNEGEICHTLDDGDPETTDGQWCETVSEGSNTCGELENDPNCTLQRTECADDARAADGLCYVENPVYECRREVRGTEEVINESTTCTGDMTPICRGSSCEIGTEPATEEQSMAKGLAAFVVADTMVSDWVDTRPRRNGGITDPREGGGGWMPLKSAGAAMSASAEPEAPATAAKAGGGAEAKNGPVPPGGFDPFAMPEGFDPNQFMTIEDHEEGYAAFQGGGGVPMNNFRLFDGKSMNCMRALGGLLNCCTKQPPPSAEPEKTFWEILTEQLRERWSGVAACQYSGVDPNDPQVQGAWDRIGQVPGNLALNSAFTSTMETMQGGGDLPACRNQAEARQENVTAEYLKQMRPKLAWFCDRDEKDLGALKKIGNCRFLGTYCRTRVLGACIDRRERYCCFNSPMSKMMRESLATQGIGGFGSARNPTCGGITMEQLGALNGADMDMEDIEGRIMESGQMEELTSLMGDDLLNRMSGDANNINNPGRVNAQQRTLDYVSQMDPSGQLPAQGRELIGTMGPAPTLERTPGKISLRAGKAWLERGPRGMALVLNRDGGKGNVGVQVVIVDGTAILGRDMNFANPAARWLPVEWGDGQTGERRVTIYGPTTARPLPPITERRSFRVELRNATGGATLITDYIDIDVEPEVQ